VSIGPELIKVFNFVVLVAIIYYLVKKGVLARLLGMEALHLGPYLKKRQEAIKTALAEADKAKQEGERKYQEYEARLANLDLEIKQLRQTLIEEGEREKERIIAEARQIGEKIKEQAALTAQQELKMAKRRVQDETASMTIELAEELLKKHLTPKDHERLVDDYIEHMKRLQ
jgi:F-type H+-transporting ATPase subunit b